MTRSDHLHVGDIIKIRKNERFPADIILLSTSNADGKVYIETSSLDG
jgi:P-type E1-E2 ATPase